MIDPRHHQKNNLPGKRGTENHAIQIITVVGRDQDRAGGRDLLDPFHMEAEDRSENGTDHATEEGVNGRQLFCGPVLLGEECLSNIPRLRLFGSHRQSVISPCPISGKVLLECDGLPPAAIAGHGRRVL